MKISQTGLQSFWIDYGGGTEKKSQLPKTNQDTKPVTIQEVREMQQDSKEVKEEYEEVSTPVAEEVHVHDAGDITTEVGVTYDGELIRTDTLAVLDSFTGNATTTATLTTTYEGEVELSIRSVRAGLESFQEFTHTFTLFV